MSKQTLAIMHPYPVVLGALSSLFQSMDHFKVIHLCLDYEQLFSSVSINPVDLLLINNETAMLDNDLKTRLQRLFQSKSSIKSIFLIDKINNDFITNLQKLGVSGVVSKRVQTDELIYACEFVLNSNEFYISDKLKNMKTLFSKNDFDLSEKEIEIIKLIATGYTLTEVADFKKRSLSTISTHKYNAMRKLGISSNAELIKFAYDNQIL